MNKELVRLHLRVIKKEFKRLLKGQKKVQSRYCLTEFKKAKSDTFFGYYDITPFGCNDKIIYTVLPEDSDRIKVVVNDIYGASENIIAESYAWNWQQSCRLRWFNTESSLISFNDFRDGKYCNRIINIIDKSERIINYPLYDIDRKCNLGLSLDFERLGRMRPGYGYTCTHIEKENIERQGVEIIDLNKNIMIKVLNYNRIASNFNREINLNNCYLNHLSFSPSGDSFLFFLVEVINGYHLASLLVYKIKEDSIVLLEDQEKVSHYVWVNENEIICTTYKDPMHCYYYRYSILNKSKEIINPVLLNEDGHPSLFKEHSILTDTYPDIQYFQKMFIYDENLKNKTEIVKIYSTPYVTGERRTDLHPRLSTDKQFIAFDANVKGKRSFYILKLKK